MVRGNFFIVFLFTFFCSWAQHPLTSSQKFHKTSGDVLVAVLPTLALGSTFIWDDESNGTLQFTKSFLATSASVYALKLLIDKERPSGESLNSFPSGHTAISFASAAFFQKRYGWKVGVPAYVLAAYVGYSRITSDKHDKWDVLAGALIGTGFSYLFTKKYNKESKVSFSLRTMDRYTTIGVTYRF
ncbi:PAP2 superfamily protein [Tenacibaculum sp. MAR_2009_124]|uniref:phosphatase PAP2 family protein n=1 Tax=Tenacibaculum sp. MAR_2009_124 TaxID=1250059 RepID=UPI00089A7A28|nr:phosphatase PAP2 family protein [Tenacibaculum sp. MAR_2009_124]SEC30158.1 PAP2 superfamily protein [Tenacibaculum sp. MAR_2009_124]